MTCPEKTPKAIPLCPCEDRQEWFLMLIAYLKMKSLAIWLVSYPLTSYEDFDLIWPTLLDQMMFSATAAAAQQLLKEVAISLN